jgi:hypothetical protein
MGAIKHKSEPRFMEMEDAGNEATNWVLLNTV